MPQQMTDLGPKSDEELAKVALDLAQYGFGDVRSLAVVEGEHLHVRVGIIGPEGFVELGVALYGDEVEAAKFAANTDPVTGKIATVVQFRKDSAAAVLDGDVVFSDDDARTWKGGVYHVARVRLADGTWRSWEFACAASGVQSSYDEMVARSVLAKLGAFWEQRELARNSAAANADVKPEPADA